MRPLLPGWGALLAHAAADLSAALVLGGWRALLTVLSRLTALVRLTALLRGWGAATLLASGRVLLAAGLTLSTGLALIPGLVRGGLVSGGWVALLPVTLG